MTSRVPTYRPDIDGLRAIAVLGVVVYHAFPSLLPGGFVGVDVFFVISGYLITRIIEGRLAQGRFSFTDFYARRIRRIFPALSVVLAVCLLVGWFLLLPGELRILGGHTVAGASFVANFAFWADIGYFDVAAETKPLLHLWSLGIEEQFYLLWPLLLWWAWRRGWRLWVVAAVVGGLSFVANVLSVGGWPDMAFYYPHTRLWELAAGALLALRPPALRWSVSPNFAAWVGAGLLLAGFALIRSSHAFPGFWAMLPVLGTVFLIEAGEQAWFNRRVLAQRAMVYCGLISFPLYLWHWPLLSFLYSMEGGAPSALLRVAAVLLAVALSVLTWRCVEQPLRHGGRPGARTRLLLGIMAGVAALAGWIWISGGVPSRFKGSVLMDEASIERERLAYWAEGEWRRNFDEGYPRIITFGDSQGFDVFKSLSLNPSIGLQHFESSHDCTAFTRPIIGKEHQGDKCRETFQRLLDSRDLPATHVFIYAHSWWSESEPDDVLAGYREALRELRAANPHMRIVFMGPKPLLGHHWVSINTLVKDQKAVAGLNDYLNSIKWIRSDDIERARELAQMFDAMFVDVAAVYCLDGCEFFMEGRFAYFDQNHWTETGARLFNEKLRRSGEWARMMEGLMQ